MVPPKRKGMAFMALRSGMVPAEGNGMAFKVRHGLFIGKGHGLLVQAGSL